MSQLYHDATAFVLPSRYEPFGIAFLEAMAHGLPCIGSEACAMPEIIKHGTTGFVVPLGHIEALTQRIVEIAEDRVLARSMGDLGRARVLERFTWEVVASRIVTSIAKAAASKASSIERVRA